MKEAKYILIGLFGLGLASSCSMMTKKYSPNDYVKWFDSENNGLTTRSTKDGITTSLKLHTLEYDAAKCLINKCDTKSNIKSQINSTKRPLVFELRYDLPGIGIFDINPAGPIDRSERMQYLSYQFKNDICIVLNGRDTIPCQNVIFERTPSDMPFAQFEINFGNAELSENSSIHILNRVIEQETRLIGFQSINNNLPQIKIKDENK